MGRFHRSYCMKKHCPECNAHIRKNYNFVVKPQLKGALGRLIYSRPIKGLFWFVFAFGLATGSIYTLNFAGYAVQTIGCNSDSMGAEYDCGDIIISKKLQVNRETRSAKHADNSLGTYMLPNATYLTEEVNKGDVLVYLLGTDYIVHRVVDFCDYTYEDGTTVQFGFVMKGDNNDFEDGCIPFIFIYSKVVWHS